MTSHNIWFRDPLQLVHNLLTNRDFENEFDYMLFQEFNAKKKQCWRDFMSGDWAWKEADIIADDLSRICKDPPRNARKWRRFGT
jgi:hypothetical protein